MNIGLSSHLNRGYTVETAVYGGPLDLLLQLIERAELDITKLALSQVTDQYLAYLRGLQEQEAEEVSAFLVVASRLLQIKSEVLLPRPPQREAEEEDPGEALARQLLIYRRFKEIAAQMEQRQNSGFRTYLRLAPSPKVEGQIDLSGFNLQDFLKAAHSVFSPEGDKRRAELGSVVAAPLITIRDRIGYIRGYLQERGRATFITLLGRGRSRIEIVVTFLALLELVKRRFVFARQAALFSDIEIEPSGNWESADNLELDFGE